MKVNLLILLIVILTQSNVFSKGNTTKYIYYGNKAYHKDEFKDAVKYYETALENAEYDFKASFNLANAYFRLKDYDKAISILESITSYTNKANEKAMVYHNIGNSYLVNQKIDEAIDAYKDALRLYPTGESTRYNLAYALELKKGKKEEKQDKGEDGEDSENESESEENKDESESEDEQEGSEDEKSKDANKDEQDNNSENKNTSKEQKKLTKSEGERLLEAAAKREKEIINDKNKRMVVGKSNSKTNKDW